MYWGTQVRHPRMWVPPTTKTSYKSGISDIFLSFDYVIFGEVNLQVFFSHFFGNGQAHHQQLVPMMFTVLGKSCLSL